MSYFALHDLSARDELQDGMSLTNQLEELRKEGGDKWLAIFNAQKSRKKDPTVSDLCVCSWASCP